ncbi:uncharacterized protein LOC123534827 [Mercenaria mercenaria]|uniref:uncharacterized protein LOC123534827 n=1 Tax=Mercenaria mercenaria TaxID=6596 RepID=UPI00234EE29B|nr:uncharacterized protein LOC123534827 [Mercenaria mercenaria]
MTGLGPFCQSAGISETSLEKGEAPPLGLVTNGLVLELEKFANERDWTLQKLLELLSQIDKNFASVVNLSALTSKLSTVKDQKKKLTSKKKVKGVKNVKELLAKQFCAPVQRTNKEICGIPEQTEQENETEICQEEIQPTLVVKTVQSPLSKLSKEVQTENETDVKEVNLLTYKIRVQERKLVQLSNKVSEKKSELENVTSAKGHYSVKNVNKRDETARKNLHALRDAQRKTIKQDKIIKKQEHYKLDFINFQQEYADLKEKVETLTEKCEAEKKKKVALQKTNSYLRGEVNQLRTQALDSCECSSIFEEEIEQNKKIKLQLAEKEGTIIELEEEINELQNLKIQTKNEHGYLENIRLCIMQLAGLEVAVEKMTSIIQVVSKHIFGKEFTKQELPNATTSQTIVDEGHYLAKAYIADKLEQTTNWGLGRDGTTRRKEKIVDTAITLASGDNISLGFTRVARETADTIQKVTEQHLNELCATKQNPDYLVETIQKLAFTMSDRASNEKRADQLLDEWRDTMLRDYGGNENDVHHFHCMAHVLLGFHSYITPDIKDFEQTLQEESGPIGRDSLSYFNSWSKKESVVNRVVRTTSDTFGPAGDHLGVRDRWDAFCCENGIKSHIGNYRDNRFNALFQTSAEVFLHRKDFIQVLATVSKPNLKLKAVKSDLESKEVCALLQCLGLFYLKLTGPYWNLVTCGKVSYFELWTHIEEIDQFLSTCEKSPEHLLLKDTHWSSSDPLDISRVPFYDQLAEQVFILDDETRDILFNVIPVVARAMLKCVHKQLHDFFPGGKFHDISPNITKESDFAPVTNLSCEHHFGDLDSSQRRRPHASYHHHSTVQLLKRNGANIMRWICDMDSSQKTDLLTSARKGGKMLRKKHREHEKNVLTEIHGNMTQESKGKKRKANTDGRNDNKKQKNDFEVVEQLCVNEYVAIAYQDNWYPGVVEKVVDDTTIVVKFMAPCRKNGYYQWPSRDDRQVVNKQFVLCTKFIPDCISSGRQWYVKEHNDITNVYSKFHTMFF